VILFKAIANLRRLAVANKFSVKQTGRFINASICSIARVIGYMHQLLKVTLSSYLLIPIVADEFLAHGKRSFLELLYLHANQYKLSDYK